MQIRPTPLAGAFVIELEPRGDDRGMFVRTFCRETFEKHGLVADYQQANHSRTRGKGTVRGLHFQYPPHAEVKVVRCTRGAILDVFVDLRNGSPTFLQWHAVELSESNLRVVYIPTGFAHGFQTLTDDCDVLYNVTATYAPHAEGKIHCQDPTLGIPWPLPVANLSPKDAVAPKVAGFAGIDTTDR
jgi:dTDP-4-dehydrorhamnose 3,5-epimerase